MSKDQPPGDSNRSALERYLAKQKQDRASQSPREASSVASKPIAQPTDLGRWEKIAADRVENAETDPLPFEQRAIESGAPALPPPILKNEPIATGIPGDFGSRLLATLIDWAILGALGYPVRRAITAVLSVVVGPVIQLHTDGLDVVVSGLLIYLYYGYFYSKKGASPGKLLLGLEVLNAETGARLTPFHALLREAIGKFISTVPFMMGFIIVLFRDDRRALHDLLFDTRVVAKKV